MKTTRSGSYTFASFVLVVSCTQGSLPLFAAECPVTYPSDSPVYIEDDVGSHDWYGSKRLAALIPVNGNWYGMGPSRDYGDKFWLWRSGYDARSEPKPKLRVVAIKPTEPGSRVEMIGGTNALDPFGFGDVMLMGLEFPSPGCWNLRVTYNNSEDLEFVLLVGANAA